MTTQFSPLVQFGRFFLLRSKSQTVMSIDFRVFWPFFSKLTYSLNFFLNRSSFDDCCSCIKTQTRSTQDLNTAFFLLLSVIGDRKHDMREIVFFSSFVRFSPESKTICRKTVPGDKQPWPDVRVWESWWNEKKRNSKPMHGEPFCAFLCFWLFACVGSCCCYKTSAVSLFQVFMAAKKNVFLLQKKRLHEFL